MTTLFMLPPGSSSFKMFFKSALTQSACSCWHVERHICCGWHPSVHGGMNAFVKKDLNLARHSGDTLADPNLSANGHTVFKNISPLPMSTEECVLEGVPRYNGLTPPTSDISCTCTHCPTSGNFAIASNFECFFDRRDMSRFSSPSGFLPEPWKAAASSAMPDSFPAWITACNLACSSGVKRPSPTSRPSRGSNVAGVNESPFCTGRPPVAFDCFPLHAGQGL